MNESTKTIAFVAIAAVALLAAYFIDRPTQAVSTNQFVGTVLNADFEVDQPKRLKITKFDRQTAQTRQFEVASVDGVWSIPSKENYPADATQQMAKAATALVDRKILRVAGETAQSHDELGVVDPLSPTLNSDSTGVGTRVQMYNADDKSLVDMIIGKAVKGSEGQRYVRESNKDVVYIVELDPESLSTNFEDWIEDDLLKISPFDIRKVFINDYSADLGFAMTPEGRIVPQVQWDRRAQITLGYNNEDAKWNLVDLKKYDRQTKEMVPDELAADEEINQEALSELRNGLDDLLIVDVAKKPEGLSADLKAGNDFMTNREAFQDLVSKGFSPVPLNPNAPPEILSSEGEIICTMRDGVEYVLRFGQLKVQTDSAAGESVTTTDPANPATGEAAAPATDPAAAAASEAAAADAEKKPEDADGKNLHRYLFVMARFNQEVIEKPNLKDLPSGEASEPGRPDAGESPPDDSASPNEEAAGDAPEAGEAAPPADEPAAPPAGGDQADAAQPTEESANDEAAPADEDGEAASAAGEPSQDPVNEADVPEQPDADKLAEVRKQIEEENKREQDRYNDTVEAGKKRVTELNERFGDWYYVISNDVYKQIHLGRDDVIKKKDAPKEGAEGAAASEANPLSGLPNLPGAASEPPSTPEGEPAASSPGESNADQGAAAASAEQPATAPQP
jgi:hypothetical protein